MLQQLNHRNLIRREILMNIPRFLPFEKYRALALTACISLLGGCASLQPVNIAQTSGRSAITKGDTLVVTTQSGQVHTFKVVDITADGVHGKEISIPYADMRLAQIRSIDVTKTLLLTVGIIGLGATASDDGGSGGY
jgi:hypothetical protein